MLNSLEYSRSFIGYMCFSEIPRKFAVQMLRDGCVLSAGKPQGGSQLKKYFSSEYFPLSSHLRATYCDMVPNTYKKGDPILRKVYKTADREDESKKELYPFRSEYRAWSDYKHVFNVSYTERESDSDIEAVQKFLYACAITDFGAKLDDIILKALLEADDSRKIPPIPDSQYFLFHDKPKLEHIRNVVWYAQSHSNKRIVLASPSNIADLKLDSLTNYNRHLNDKEFLFELSVDDYVCNNNEILKNQPSRLDPDILVNRICIFATDALAIGIGTPMVDFSFTADGIPRISVECRLDAIRRAEDAVVIIEVKCEQDKQQGSV